MIPDYKLYHGAVLADIVDKFDGAVSFRESVAPGRLLNYVINDVIGLQIKYSTARLRPWCFSYPLEHIEQLGDLLKVYPRTFAVLVCHMDGFVAISATQLLSSLRGVTGGQAWLRVNRKRREMYRVFGPNGEFPTKFRTTNEPIVEALRQARSEERSGEVA